MRGLQATGIQPVCESETLGTTLGIPLRKMTSNSHSFQDPSVAGSPVRSCIDAQASMPPSPAHTAQLPEYFPLA